MSRTVNNVAVGGRGCAGQVVTSQGEGALAPWAKERVPALQLQVGHGQTSMGLGMVKSSQSFSPELSLPEPQVKVVTAMGALAGRVTRT